MDGAPSSGDLLRSLESLASDYASASPKSLLPLSDCLDSLFQRTKSDRGRQSLEEQSALERVVPLIPLMSSHCSALALGNKNGMRNGLAVEPNWAALRPLKLLLRSIRNMCVGLSLSKVAFRLCGGHALVSDAVDQLLDHFQISPSTSDGSGGILTERPPVGRLPEDVLDLFATILQLLGNFCGQVEANQAEVWARWFPSTFERLGSVIEAKVQEPLCMVLFTCVRFNDSRASQLARSDAGTAVVARLLRSVSESHVESLECAPPALRATGGGEWLEILVQHLFIHKPFLNSFLSSFEQTRSVESPISNATIRLFESIPVVASQNSMQWGKKFFSEQLTLLSIIQFILETHLKPNSGAMPAFDIATRDSESKTSQKKAMESAFCAEVTSLLNPIADLVKESALAVSECHALPLTSSTESITISMSGSESAAVVPSHFSSLNLSTSSSISSSPPSPSQAPIPLSSDNDGGDDPHASLNANSLDRELVVHILRSSMSILRLLFTLYNESRGNDESKLSRNSANRSRVQPELSEIIGNSDTTDEVLIQRKAVLLALSLLKSLGPPEEVKKQEQKRIQAMENGKAKRECSAERVMEKKFEMLRNPTEVFTSQSSFPSICPYIGYRTDIVAIIGNACYQNRANQDLIRETNALILLLQQCMVEEGNPYLREWGLWAVRNLLWENEENQKLVRELELKESVQNNQLLSMGYKIELDQISGKPRLVNVSALEKFKE